MTAADATNPPNRTALDRARSYEYALVPIATAEKRLDRERREIEVEARALGRFTKRVESIEPTHVEPTRPPGVGSVQRQRSGSESLDRVLEAYRETVMDVPHYDRAYGESLSANVAAEFGLDVANGLCSGDTGLTPQLKEALLATATAARLRREEYLDTLRAEADSIDESRAALADVAEALSAYSRRDDPDAAAIDELIGRVDRVVAERQTVLHRRRAHSNTDGHDLYAYLLEEDTWTYPVLYAATSLRQEADALRRHAE